MFHDLHTQCLGFGDNLSYCSLKQYGVHGSVDLEVLTDIVCGTRRIELLSKPNSKLGS